jgi:Flp pilus assembly protein TadB
MATVRITLTPDALMQPIDVGGWQPQGTARDAVRMLLRTLQFFADLAILLGVYVLPVLVVVAIPVTLVVLLIRALVRRARRRKRERAAE